MAGPVTKRDIACAARWLSSASMSTRRVVLSVVWAVAAATVFAATVSVMAQAQTAGQPASAGPGFPDYSKITNEKEFTNYVIKYRTDLDAAVSKPWAERALKELPVKYQATKIAGVPVEDFEPAGGVAPS